MAELQQYHPLDGDREDGLDIEQTTDLEQKVINHRNKFREIFINRYREIIINLRQYQNLPPSINKYQIEHLLRNGSEVVIGKNKYGIDCILGINKNGYTPSDPRNYYAVRRLNYGDIQWTLPEDYRPVVDNVGEYHEITGLDNAASGDFVVLRNKPVTYLSDFSIIDEYADEIAELITSRFSLIIQSKIMTILQGTPNDESLNQVASAVYNGTPFLKTTKLLNLERNVLTIGNQNAGELLKTYKEVYNNLIEELNNHLGINSAGISKASGVSDQEVNANNDMITANANMYVNGVEEPLLMYNKRFDTNYHVFMQTVPTSDISGVIYENHD